MAVFSSASLKDGMVIFFTTMESPLMEVETCLAVSLKRVTMFFMAWLMATLAGAGSSSQLSTASMGN